MQTNNERNNTTTMIITKRFIRLPVLYFILQRE